MKMNLVGIWGLLLLFSIGEIQGQSYAPHFEVSTVNNTIAPGTVITTPLNTNELEFDLNYLSSGLPKFSPFWKPEDYTPLEVFWEFTYNDYPTPGRQVKEYSSEKTPRMFFPKTGNGTKLVNVKVWTIDAYDDDEPPPRAYGFDLNYTGNTNPILTTPSQPKMTIIPSWSPSSGDTVIYTVRMEFNCDDVINGTLSFDYSQFANMVDMVVPYKGVDDPIAQTVQWLVNGDDFLRGVSTSMKYLDFSVLFDVNNGVSPGKAFNSLASYQSSNPGFCPGAPDVAKSDTVGVSHDPNNKLILQPDPITKNKSELLCLANDDDGLITVRYKIEFQNIGAAPATQVTIEDWLDEAAHVHSVRYLGAEYTPTKSTTLDLQTSLYAISPEGYLYWKFEIGGLGLRGTDENLYLIDFPDEDTRSWINIEVKYDAAVLDTCSALMNHARVTFDCNPEFYTPTAIAKVTALEVNNPHGPCPSCDEIIEKTLTKTDLDDIGGTVTGYQLSNTILQEIDAAKLKRDKVNWYPDRWIENANTVEAIMRPLEDITYTLVVTSGDVFGARAVYRIFIDANDGGRNTPQPFVIKDDDNPSDCTSTPVIIGGSPPFDYSWENTTTGKSITISGGTVTCNLTVTDAHGCTNDFSTTITCPGIPYWQYGVLAAIAIFIIVGLVRWLRRRGG